MTIETKQCSLCCDSPPYRSCAAHDDGVIDVPVCALLLAYETAKLPAMPLFPVIVHDRGFPTETSEDMCFKKDYDKLRRYASRLAVDLSLLNGIITRAARDAQKYVDAAERSLDHG